MTGVVREGDRGGRQLNRRSFVFAVVALVASRDRLFARRKQNWKPRRIQLAPLETTDGFWVLLPLKGPRQAGFEIDQKSKIVTLVKRRDGSLEAVELESGFVVLLPVDVNS